VLRTVVVTAVVTMWPTRAPRGHQRPVLARAILRMPPGGGFRPTGRDSRQRGGSRHPAGTDARVANGWRQRRPAWPWIAPPTRGAAAPEQAARATGSSGPPRREPRQEVRRLRVTLHSPTAPTPPPVRCPPGRRRPLASARQIRDRSRESVRVLEQEVQIGLTLISARYLCTSSLLGHIQVSKSS
jgi:hypothetical protein